MPLHAAPSMVNKSHGSGKGDVEVPWWSVISRPLHHTQASSSRICPIPRGVILCRQCGALFTGSELKGCVDWHVGFDAVHWRCDDVMAFVNCPCTMLTRDPPAAEWSWDQFRVECDEECVADLSSQRGRKNLTRSCLRPLANSHAR